MTDTHDAAPANGRTGHKRRIILIVLLLGACFAAVQYMRGMNRVSTDDAFVDGRIYQITPRVDGYILQCCCPCTCRTSWATRPTWLVWCWGRAGPSCSSSCPWSAS